MWGLLHDKSEGFDSINCCDGAFFLGDFAHGRIRRADNRLTGNKVGGRKEAGARKQRERGSSSFFGLFFSASFSGTENRISDYSASLILEKLRHRGFSQVGTGCRGYYQDYWIGEGRGQPNTRLGRLIIESPTTKSKPKY